MEHRLDNRIQAPIKVTIQTGKRSIFKTRANNLSRGGVNVKMDIAWDIRKKRLVFVEFMEKRLSAKIPALVVQTTAISASLMFIEHSPEVQSFLSYRNG